MEHPPSLPLATVRYLRSIPELTGLVSEYGGAPAIYHTRFAGFKVEGSKGAAVLVSLSSQVEVSFDPFDRAILMIEAWVDPARDSMGTITSYDQDERAIVILKMIKHILTFTGDESLDETVWSADRQWPSEDGIRVLDCCMMREPHPVNAEGDQQQGDGQVRWRMSLEVCYG